ncbi:MAG: hypothetical protein MHM6MM_006402 [Cercozoa sp. M6MM]
MFVARAQHAKCMRQLSSSVAATYRRQNVLQRAASLLNNQQKSDDAERRSVTDAALQEGVLSMKEYKLMRDIEVDLDRLAFSNAAALTVPDLTPFITSLPNDRVRVLALAKVTTKTIELVRSDASAFSLLELLLAEVLHLERLYGTDQTLQFSANFVDVFVQRAALHCDGSEDWKNVLEQAVTAVPLFHLSDLSQALCLLHLDKSSKAFTKLTDSLFRKLETSEKLPWKPQYGAAVLRKLEEHKTPEPRRLLRRNRQATHLDPMTKLVRMVLGRCELPGKLLNGHQSAETLLTVSVMGFGALATFRVC